METVLASEKLIAQLFDNQPDAVVWYKPVLAQGGEGHVIDFEVQYLNHMAARWLGAGRNEVIGKKLRSYSFMGNPSADLIFEQNLLVWNSGEPMEHLYFNANFDRYFNVQRSKVEGGILNVSRDRTHEMQIELQLQSQERQYQSIIDNATDGVILLNPTRDEKGAVTDFEITYCNEYAIEVGQLPTHYEGKTLLQLLPHIRRSEQFGLHQQVAETGEPVRYETTFQSPEGKEYGWFIVSLTRVDDKVVSRFVDISERKRFEQTISKQAYKLNQILTASLNAVVTMEAVRDGEETIIDLRYTQVNKRFLQWVGKTEENVVGKTMLELFPAAAEQGLFAIYQKALQSGLPQHVQIEYGDSNISGWYELSVGVIDKDTAVGTFNDITAQKKAYLEIEKQKVVLDNILQYSPSGITIVEAIRDEQGKVVDIRHLLVNEQAEKFIGFSKELLLAKTNRELDPGFGESRLLQELAHTLETGKTAYTDYLLPTGQWIEGAASRMDKDRLICVFCDVTLFKEQQQQMKTVLEELKRSNKSLEEFAYAASHDLQEPLRKINFFTDRLKKGLTTAKPADNQVLLNRIEAATNRMNSLISDLLSYSQVSIKPNRLDQVDLNETVEMVLQDLEAVVAETQSIICVNELPAVKGDERQLRQLFQNLLSNAIKYRKAGEPSRVEVRGRTVQGNDPDLRGFPEAMQGMFHLIEVEDNGIGFEQEDAERIFNVFTRLHGNTEYTGTGVGLAIVKQIATNHKGFVAAESKPGAGATFKLLLPK